MGTKIAIRQEQYLLKKMSKEDKNLLTNLQKNWNKKKKIMELLLINLREIPQKNIMNALERKAIQCLAQ